jgi:hypothetical protein
MQIEFRVESAPGGVDVVVVVDVVVDVVVVVDDVVVVAIVKILKLLLSILDIATLNVTTVISVDVVCKTPL